MGMPVGIVATAGGWPLLETEVAAFSAFAAEFLESGYKAGVFTGVDPARFLPLAID